MEKTSISVIVPVYNGASCIEQCIESIENQKYDNLEVIIINDGSTDNTKSKCEALKKKYNNIKLINQKNSGVSNARNKGIETAKGEYLMFVDSDDFIDGNMLEIMMKNKKNDLIISNYKKFYDSKIISNDLNLEKNFYTKNLFFENFWDLYDANLINSPCFRIYRSNIIKTHNIRFNPDYDLGEDLIFNLEYIDKCKTIYITPISLYNYRYSENSLTTKYRDDYLKIQLNLINYLKEFFISNNKYNDKARKQLDLRTCYVIIGSIQNLFLASSGLTKLEKKKKINEYFKMEEIKLFKHVKFNNVQLKLMQKLIINRNTNIIILYSEFKEKIRKIFYGGISAKWKF